MKCLQCGKYIWFWQKRTLFYHDKCFRQLDKMMMRIHSFVIRDNSKQDNIKQEVEELIKNNKPK